MSVTRLVLEGHDLQPGELLVPEAPARHARVARVQPGDPIEVLDLAGAVAVGRLLRWEGGACRVSLERIERERGEPSAPLVLALGLLHTAAFDWAVEKAAELGATRIVPVVSERSQGGRHESRVDRWRRIAAAAVAQCGRTRPPGVDPPEPLAAVLAGARGVLLLAEPAASAPAPFRVGEDGITVLVGPEGGFTSREIAAARDAGFLGLPLGPRTLRAETAALAALATAAWIGADWNLPRDHPVHTS
ncbi:MAG: RsmE family RNA methyltransferase [Acidobacteriota bacterium]